MFDMLYECYAKSWILRAGYQVGVVISWALWAKFSLAHDDATWLVFGWLPGIFWPIQLIAILLAHLWHAVPILNDIFSLPG